MINEVVVVIGAGGIGQAIGRREGTGRTVLLADRSAAACSSSARSGGSGPATRA
jgi:saccharopine dehydrogenase-like NADP-dependent oxidoreductase